jgi:hypothetical protein
MPSRKFVWDPEHWRFRAEEARTVADQMTHEEARTVIRPDRFHSSDTLMDDRVRCRMLIASQYRVGTYLPEHQVRMFGGNGTIISVEKPCANRSASVEPLGRTPFAQRPFSREPLVFSGKIVGRIARIDQPGDALGLRAAPSFEASGRVLETADPFCSQIRRAAHGRTRFKPPAHLAVRLPTSHMTVSQADPSGSMTPWRQS